MTAKLYYDIVSTTKQRKKVRTIEKNYIVYKLRLAIGFLLNGNIQQAINILRDVIAYLEDLESDK